MTVVEHTLNRANDRKYGKGKTLPKLTDVSTGEEGSEYTPVYSVKSCEPCIISSRLETYKLTPRKLKNRRAKEINKAKKEHMAMIKAVDEVRIQRAEENLFVPVEKLVGKSAKNSTASNAVISPKKPTQKTTKDARTSMIVEKKSVNQVPETMAAQIMKTPKEAPFAFVDRFLQKYPDSRIPLTRACTKWGLCYAKRKGEFLMFVDEQGLSPSQVDSLEDLSSFIKLLVKKCNRQAPPGAVTSRYCTCVECSNFGDYPAWIEGVKSFYTVSQYNSVKAAKTKNPDFKPKLTQAARAAMAHNQNVLKEQMSRMKTKPTPRSMALNFAYQENPDINTSAELRQHFRQNPDVSKDHICDL